MTYGITIELRDSVAEENPSLNPDGGDDEEEEEEEASEPIDTSGWDCRYKQVTPCQGESLEAASDSQR